jgi:hypothetical protein
MKIILKLCLVIQVSYIYWAQHSRLFSPHDLRVETEAAFKTDIYILAKVRK